MQPSASISKAALPWWGLPAIGLMAASIRLAHALAFANHPLATHPQLDAEFYHRWALDSLQGVDLGTHVLWSAPAYPAFVTAVYRIFGPGLAAIQFLQSLAGVLTCLLLTVTLTRVFSSRQALAAGFLWTLYPLNPYYESFLLPTCWIVDLNLVALFGLLWACEKPAFLRYLVAGLTWGLLCVTSENYLYLAAPLLLFYFRSLQQVMAFGLGVALLIAPVTLRNYELTGELIPVSAHGGEAVYLANNPRTDGLYNPMYHGFQKMTGHDQQREKASQMAGRPLNYGEANRFWFGKAASFILEQPWPYARLFANKVLLAMHDTELPNNEDYRYLRFASPVLHYNPLSFGVLFPFAVLGLAAAWRQRRRFALLYFFFAVNVVPILVVFAASRYRMPLLPFITAFAVLGAVSLLQRPRWLKLVLLIGLLAVSNRPWDRLQTNLDWSAKQMASIAVAENRLDDAIASYQEALRLDPANRGTAFALGQTLAAAGRFQEAYRTFQTLERAHPNKPKVRLEMARMLRALGRCEVAIPLLQSLLPSNPPNQAAIREELAHCQTPP